MKFVTKSVANKTMLRYRYLNFWQKRLIGKKKSFDLPKEHVVEGKTTTYFGLTLYLLLV